MAIQVINQSQAAGTTLGYAQITASATTSSTTAVQITGLTATVTVPAGGRRVRISCYTASLFTSAASTVRVTLWDGAVGTGTQLQFGEINQGSATNTAAPVNVSIPVVPSAGSKTYNVGLQVGAGTGTLYASSTSPAYLLVELI